MPILETTIDKYCDDLWDNKFTQQTMNFWNGKGNIRKLDQESKLTALTKVFCSSEKTLLDVGCGNCRLYNGLNDTFEYTGLDGSAFMLREAPSKVRVIHSNVLGFKSDVMYGVVLCSHVIRHNPRRYQYKVLEKLFELSSNYVIILNTFTEHWYAGECINGHIPDNPLIVFEFELFCWKHRFEPLVRARLENAREHKIDYIYILKRMYE
jgi:2-polyprenyl-3-methyl-5-hydroxy-6-metoxy-1,4-benzoquinol methylase